MSKDQFAYLNDTIISLESSLAQAREEIDRIKGRKGPSLCCRVYAMPVEAKLAKAEEEIQHANMVAMGAEARNVKLEAKLTKLESSHACDGPEESRCRACDRLEKLERVRESCGELIGLCSSNGIDDSRMEIARSNLAALRETEER